MSTVTRKRCIKCRRPKVLDDFYEHPQMADGRLNKCKRCCRQDAAANRQKNGARLRRYERKRNGRLERRRQQTATCQRMRRKWPGKYRARMAVNNALRDGRLKKGPCETCGTTRRVQAHHEDYRKPLDVRWFCANHHER